MSLSVFFTNKDRGGRTGNSISARAFNPNVYFMEDRHGRLVYVYQQGIKGFFKITSIYTPIASVVHCYSYPHNHSLIPIILKFVPDSDYQ
jgi:hypothetical protein